MKKKVVLILATLMCISLCACGGSEEISKDSTGIKIENNIDVNKDTKTEESSNTSLLKKEIEITLDNWQEYFEEKDVLGVEYNAFDEIEDIYFYKNLTLKEGISIDTYESNIAVEANVHYEQYYVNIDTNTWEFSFEEKRGEFEYSSSKIEEFRSYIYKQGDSEKKYYSAQFCRFGDNMVMTDKETQTTYVERVFIDEITRIKGTLYIIEE